jgi:2-oxo-3-hexenedioate decarboxylase
LDVEDGPDAVDPAALAAELLHEYASRRIVSTLPSSRDPSFDLAKAYQTESEVVRMRRTHGGRTVGLKVGYANKALWRVFKLDTLVWAHMYAETVHYAPTNETSLSIERMCSPKIEPEIVFKLKRRVPSGALEAETVLESVEWLALGFEIIDCVFADWKFQPVDFVAAFGLHAALVLGEPRWIEPDSIPAIVSQLAQFKVSLAKDGVLMGEGSGRNSLLSPALCLRELVSAISRQPGAEPLEPGELVSSGTLTESLPIASGETWTVSADGVELPALTLTCV